MTFDELQIPDYTLDGIHRYIDEHCPVGGFLQAVLSNDLREAFARADDNNCRALFHIVAWLYNNAPSDCWGSPDRYTDWIGR